MVDVSNAIGTFNVVRLLKPEAVQALADAMHLRDPEPSVTVVEGTWVTGVFAANDDIVIMDRRHYDAIVAILKNPLQIQVAGTTSDGYHSFDELYAHRDALLLALMRALSGVYRTWVDNDLDTPGWFLAGIDTPHGQISYHLAEEMWATAVQCATSVFVREPYDGYTSADVLKRVQALAGYPESGVQP